MRMASSVYTPAQDNITPNFPAPQPGTNAAAIDVLPPKKKRKPAPNVDPTLEFMLDQQHGATQDQNDRPNANFDERLVKWGPGVGDWSLLHQPNEMNPTDRTLM